VVGDAVRLRRRLCRRGARGAVHHPQVCGLQAQTDLFHRAFARRAYARDFLRAEGQDVENIGEELTAWADTNDKEIARLKETEQFRKQYLGNVAHELKTPIFNIQGYISTLLDGGLEDELINRKYLERARRASTA